MRIYLDDFKYIVYDLYLKNCFTGNNVSTIKFSSKIKINIIVIMYIIIHLCDKIILPFIAVIFGYQNLALLNVMEKTFSKNTKTEHYKNLVYIFKRSKL